MSTEFGRLAMRVEGDWWVAYSAKPNTMDGSVELGRIRMTLAGVPAIKAATLEYYKLVFSKMVEAATGARLEWPTAERAAPEHEKAGRA